jgi:alkylhydroperoxidase family enzyme
VAHVSGTPDEIRSRVPAVLDAWEFMRDKVLTGGLVEPQLKQLCFRFLADDPEATDRSRVPPREQLALRWAQAIAWDSTLADDALWDELHDEFSDPELVELGCSIGFALGQQHFERTLGLGPHAGLP